MEYKNNNHFIRVIRVLNRLRVKGTEIGKWFICFKKSFNLMLMDSWWSLQKDYGYTRSTDADPLVTCKLILLICLLGKPNHLWSLDVNNLN